MLTSISSRAVSNSEGTVFAEERHIPGVSLPELTALAAKGLAAMFDAERQLFCFRLKRSEGRLIREGLSLRYSIISLLGLQRLKAAGTYSTTVKVLLDSWMRSETSIVNIGDRGLMLWLCALASPERLEEVYPRLDIHRALVHCRDAREGRSMELAWILSGLAHAGSVPGQKLRGLGELAVQTYRLLEQNHGAGGPFGHLARHRALSGILRGYIGSFADQAYPIYALAKFASVFEMPKALEPALACADAICRAQGAFGEWWWHYHSHAGRVLQRYPVYSVHQHGMAPMALFALSEASRVDFSEPVYKGLRWIAGNNDLGVDLQARSEGVIWRGLYHARAHAKYFGDALTYFGFARTQDVCDLQIRYECRPYELGWLLYAFADIARRQQSRPSNA